MPRNVGTSFPGGWRKRMLNAGESLVKRTDRTASIGSVIMPCRWAAPAVGSTHIISTPGRPGMERGRPKVRFTKENSCASTYLHASFNANNLVEPVTFSSP